MQPKIRVTGLLVEDGALLVVKQVLKERSNWNLPGGSVDFGETLEQSLIREMREETGLEVEVLDLLYICDRFKGLKGHVVDISFAIKRIGGTLISNPSALNANEQIASTKMLPLDQLPSYGFSQKFTNLVKQNFPQKGTYQGDFHAFYNPASP